MNEGNYLKIAIANTPDFNEIVTNALADMHGFFSNMSNYLNEAQYKQADFDDVKKQVLADIKEFIVELEVDHALNNDGESRTLEELFIQQFDESYDFLSKNITDCESVVCLKGMKFIFDFLIGRGK